MPTHRSRIKRKPVRGAFVRYQDRIAEVLGDTRSERVVIRSVHAGGARSNHSGVDLLPLDQQRC
jgi:hypothetical protein